MAISTTIQQPCVRCGQPVSAVLHGSFVIEDDASLHTILGDRFHLFDCGACGERRAFEADFLVTNGPRDLFVQVITKDADVPGMVKSMKEMLGGAKVHARIVANREDLVEKVKLWSLQLDDVAIEVLKFFVRVQINDLEGKSERFFDRIEGPEVLFRVRAPGRPVQTVKVPLLVYDNVIREMRTPEHAHDLEVDERLARRLTDARQARSAASVKAAPAPEEAALISAPCPVCKGLVPRGEPFCEACGVGLRWAGDGGVVPSYPDLLPGNVLVSEAFETRPFPGRQSVDEYRAGVVESRAVPGGKGMTYYAPVTSSFVDYARPLRDACVRSTFTPLDPGVRIGLCARHSILGGIQIYYLFDLTPLTGRAVCSRAVGTPQHASSTMLVPEVKIAPIAPGSSIELEMRVAGPTLHAFVNRIHVLSAHDASFGAGSFGIRVGREHDVAHPVRVICHGYEVREVMP